MTRATMRSLAAGAAFAALVASASGGWAQTIAADRDQQPRSETEGQAPPATNPSERLDRQNGVMQPPRGVDPQMQVPPPPGSQPTPVIPPPGSPGGDPTIQPK
jgi:hypothetical protein